MVLLKNELCWEWDDVLFFVTNQRSERSPLSDEIESKMRNWNSLDNAIHNHFNATFWRKIGNCENFEEDLNVLNTKLEEVKNKCLKQDANYEDYFDLKIKRFEVRPYLILYKYFYSAFRRGQKARIMQIDGDA